MDSETNVLDNPLPTAYYGDYSQEIYQYLLEADYGNHFESIENDLDKISSTSSSVLAALIFFIFLFFAFKFIRQRGLDL